MDILLGIVLLGGGLLSIGNFLIEKNGKIKEFFTVIMPAKGIVGILLLALSIFHLIKLFTRLDMINYIPLFFIMLLAGVIVAMLEGGILGAKFLQKIIIKIDTRADDKYNSFLSKVNEWETILGFSAIMTGIFTILATFNYSYSVINIFSVLYLLVLVTVIVISIKMGFKKSYVSNLVSTNIKQSISRKSNKKATIEDLERYSKMYKEGLLTQEEFEIKKKELL